MSALTRLARLGSGSLRLLPQSPLVVARPAFGRVAALRRFPLARVFSASTGKPSTALDYPEDAESRKQLESGNTAEAYGFSKDAGAIGESGVLEKYGVYPIAALTLAAAISKELIIMNEEVVLAGCFLTAAVSGYISLREPIIQSFEESRTEIRVALEESYNAQIEYEKERYKQAMKMTTATEDMEIFVQELVAWKKSVIERIPKVAEAQIKTEISKALAEVLEYENKIVANYAKDFVESCTAHVRNSVRNATKETKDAVLDGAIEELRTGSRSTRLGSPQVMSLFRDYFNVHKPNWENIVPKDAWWQHFQTNYLNKMSPEEWAKAADLIPAEKK